ncbi:MAG: hypothetical protein R3E31_04510 [Chloroflexota bacterium]
MLAGIVFTHPVFITVWQQAVTAEPALPLVAVACPTGQRHRRYPGGGGIWPG